MPLSHPPNISRGNPLAIVAQWMTAKPWLAVLAATAITLAALGVALQIQPATGVQDMLADDQPSAMAFGKMIDRYALVDNLVILAELPASHSEADPDRLISFATRLEAALDREPFVAAVRFRPAADARAFIKDCVVPRGWDYLDSTGKDHLRKRLTREAMDAQFAQNKAMLAAPGPAAGQLARELIQDPLRLRDFLTHGGLSASGGFKTRPGVNATVSADGRAILIEVSGVKPASDLEFTAAFMPRIRHAVGMTLAIDSIIPELVIHYTGAYAIAEYSAGQTRADMTLSCMCSIALLIGCFLVVYRHPLAFPVLLLPVGMAIVWAFGLYAGFSGHLTPVTAVTGAVLAGLGIDYCVHFVAHHELERKRVFAHANTPDSVPTPALRRTAMIRSMTHVGPAITAACITSLLGFGAILTSQVRALREFATLGILGLAAALITALLVLPALLLALDNTRVTRRGLSATRISIAPAITRIARTPRPWLALTFMLVAAATLVVGFAAVQHGGLPVQIDRDLNALHPQPHPPLDAQNLLADRFGAAPDGLTLLVEADTPEHMLALAHKVQNRLSRPALQALGLGRVNGPASLLPNPATRHDVRPDPTHVVDQLRNAADAAGFNPAAFDDYATFLTQLLTPQPPLTFADVRRYPGVANLVLPKNQPEPTQGLVLITLDHPWRNADQRDAMIESVRQELNGLSGVTLTGISVLGYDTQKAIARGIGKLLGASLLGVLLWLILFFRHPGHVLLALGPALASIVLLLATLWLSGNAFNLINLIAVPLLVGIGVDDGIFLTTLYRQARKQGESLQHLRENLAASAHAIGMTSLTTALAFGSLYFTHVPAIKSLGLMVGVGVIGALFVSVCGLVPLLMLMHARHLSTSKRPA